MLNLIWHLKVFSVFFGQHSVGLFITHKFHAFKYGKIQKWNCTKSRLGPARMHFTGEDRTGKLIGLITFGRFRGGYQRQTLLRAGDIRGTWVCLMTAKRVRNHSGGVVYGYDNHSYKSIHFMRKVCHSNRLLLVMQYGGERLLVWQLSKCSNSI